MKLPDAKSYRWIATIEDITERRKLEQERHRNYAFLSQIIDHIPTQITVKDAQAARKSVFIATGFIGYFYILTFIIGFGAITLVSTNPEFLDAAKLAGG